jgi:serine/threonine protein kinase
VMVPVADAIAAAHARGILHRDLKPQNVFLAPGRVVVLDFGIAKLLPSWGEHSRLTHTGAVLGTPRYMAPEQLFGESDPDERADVWAMGALLYCMLAGRPPIDGRTAGEVMKALRHAARVDLAEAVPGLPDGVLALVRGALVADRAGRSGSARTFAEVLHGHLE